MKNILLNAIKFRAEDLYTLNNPDHSTVRTFNFLVYPFFWISMPWVPTNQRCLIECPQRSQYQNKYHTNLEIKKTEDQALISINTILKFLAQVSLTN